MDKKFYIGGATMFKKILLLMTAVLFIVNGSVFASSMTIVDLPATGTDAAIGIDETKTYTHTFDFGLGNEATINGVEILSPFFEALSAPFEDVSPQGYGYIIDDARWYLDPPYFSIHPHNGSDVSDLCDGNSADLLGDMIFLSAAKDSGRVDGILVTLKDLTPGTEYSVRYYYRPWDPDQPRPLTILGDGASNGVFSDSIKIDIDTPGAAHYLDYTFVADDNDVTINFVFHSYNQGPHIYGLTCEMVSGTNVESKPGARPSTYGLMQNYPNPFNPNTNIQFQIPKNGHVTISVYNSLGQQVATLVDENLKCGVHHVTFDAAQFSSGIYFYRIQADDFSQVKKMILLK